MIQGEGEKRKAPRTELQGNPNFSGMDQRERVCQGGSAPRVKRVPAEGRCDPQNWMSERSQIG